ncbi:hypothetical protein GQX73_g10591 [Xylaria multiplex]|uniref:Enoyl reductase (ER) domain-containing protein n=1 Tax=Xylaria multiplex TaxID=323545 RepID=A0A7C8MZQ6_9PEZI|nr:hypothetical protein GQX73_g10591 [Xylaria multiplex]
MGLQLSSPDLTVGMFSYHRLLGVEPPGSRQATLPDPPLLLNANMKLTLSLTKNTGKTGECSNSGFRHGMWLTDPTLVTPDIYKDVGFLTHLGLFCATAKVRDCTNTRCREVFAVMRGTAPECDWGAFRHWALAAMSCQATLAMSCRERLAKPGKGSTFTDEVRRNLPHTHLVYAAHGCFWILENSREVKPLFQPTHDGFPSPNLDLRGVCNVIYWMANIQAFNDLGVAFSRRWDHHYLVPEVTLPPIWQATRKIHDLDLCSCRFWNFVNLAERKQSDLPDIVHALEKSSRRDILYHSGHQHCAPTKCEYSHLDSTKVEQLHKCEHRDCEQSKYPVELLGMAAELGEGTVWSISSPELNAPGIPYVAISHVWSDGTGVGVKSQGCVNRCLFEYFARITKSLNCDGIWWDALSIPMEPKARAKAIGQMHKNYADAEYTVIHDQYLLNIEYTDSETACLSMILSPWFTRGWTALELRMSNRVKVLFKGSNSANPVIKDLDHDILAKDPRMVSRAHWLASSMISRLRTATINYIDDILAILRPRSTSWVRDRTVIAGLLLRIPGLDISGSEGEILRAIITHIGRVPYSALLHGMPTMFETGSFSWCPPTLDDMPIDLTIDLDKRNAREVRMLHVSENGALTGRWHCEVVTERQIKNKRLEPHGSHISVAVHFYNALLKWENCLILRERKGDTSPALLVQAIQLDRKESVIDCNYIGAVRISEDDQKEDRDDGSNAKEDDGKNLPSVRLERRNTPGGESPRHRSTENSKEHFKKRSKGVDDPWYKTPGVESYSPPQQEKTEDSEDGNLEPSVDRRLLGAFQTEHAENLIHLLISWGVGIPSDIENALSFKNLTLLSRAYLRNNMLTESQRVCQRAIQMLEKVHNTAEIPNLEERHALAKVCWKAGLVDEANGIYGQVIEKRDLETVQDRQIRLQATGELSLLLIQLNRIDEAFDCYQTGLGINPPAPGYAFGYHPISRMQLSYSHRSALDCEEEKLYMRFLSMLQMEVGSSHAITVITYLNLAGATLRKGEVAEAEDMLNSVIRSLEKNVGHDHLLILRTKLEVARLHILQGRITMPEQLGGLRRECENSLGRHHWLSRLANITIGGIYEKLRQFDDALQFLQYAQETLSGQSDATSTYLAACAKRDIGIVYAQEDKPDEARNECQGALEELKKLSNPETMEFYVTLFCLGVIDGVEQTFQESLTGLERLCGPSDLETREVASKLGRLCKPMLVKTNEVDDSRNESILRAMHQLTQLLERFEDVVVSRGRVERALERYDGFFTAQRSYPFEAEEGLEIVDCELEDDEILVNVVAVAINQTNSDHPYNEMDDASSDSSNNDWITADDVAGRVVKVGSKAGFQKGDRVLGHAVYSATKDERHKGFCKHTVLLSNMASRIPQTLTFEDAAVLPLGVSTAAAALFQDEFLKLPPPLLRPRRNENKSLLVIEGTTSAGMNAIQLATAAGCKVVTTALPKNFNYVKELGACQVADSRHPDLVQELAKTFRSREVAGKEIVGVFDTRGSEDTMGTAIKLLGKVSGTGIVVSVSEVPENMVLDGIVCKVVTATSIRHNNVSKRVYGEFLPRALEMGRYKVTPGTSVVSGFGSIQASLEAGKKVVVTL